MLTSVGCLLLILSVIYVSILLAIYSQLSWLYLIAKTLQVSQVLPKAKVNTL